MLPTTTPPNAGRVIKLDASTRESAQTVLDAFLEGRKPSTLRTYKRCLADFATFLGWQSHQQTEALESLFVLSQGEANLTAHKYRTNLLERGLSPATVNNRLAALRSAVKLARTFGHVPWTLEVPNVRGGGIKDTKGPGHHVVKRLLEAALRQGGGMAKRDVAMMRLLFDLALRRSEVVSLDWSHVDLEGNRLFVLRKGYRERQWLSLTKTAKETIEQWMEWYRPGGEGEKGLPLFVNFDRSEKDRNGGRLTDSGLYHVVRKLGKMCGRNNIHPHAIRHTAVTQAVEAATAKGYNLKDVLPYSGHKNITTLMVYVDQQRDVQGDLAESVGSTV